MLSSLKYSLKSCSVYITVPPALSYFTWRVCTFAENNKHDYEFIFVIWGYLKHFFNVKLRNKATVKLKNPRGTFECLWNWRKRHHMCHTLKGWFAISNVAPVWPQVCDQLNNCAWGILSRYVISYAILRVFCQFIWMNCVITPLLSRT